MSGRCEANSRVVETMSERQRQIRCGVILETKIFLMAMKVSLKCMSRVIAKVTSQLISLLKLLHVVAKKLMLKVLSKAVTVKLTMVVMEEIV